MSILFKLAHFSSRNMECSGENSNSNSAFPTELGAPSAYNTLRPKKRSWFVLVTVKRPVLRRRTQSEKKEEPRTSIYKSPFPIEFLRLLNGENNAHQQYSRLMASIAVDATSSTAANESISSPERFRQLIENANGRQSMLRQLAQETDDDPAAVGIIGCEDSNDAVPPQQPVRTRRRGRRSFRHDIAAIFGPLPDEKRAEELRRVCNDGTRTIKSRCAISHAIAEITKLNIGLNEGLISGQTNHWIPKIDNGLLVLSRKQPTGDDKRDVFRIEI